MKTDDLDDVYGAKTPEQSRALYNKWSSKYDVDCLGKGFWLPFLAAGTLARHLGQAETSILDAGCGTGLVGKMLHQMGYGPLTGCDLSPQMLEAARASGAYADLHEADMGASLPMADDTYGAFICTGSFGPGHAPPSTLRHLARVTKPGGIGVFNVVEETFADQGFAKVIEELCQTGSWSIRQEITDARAFLLGEEDLMVRIFVVEISRT